MSESRVNWITRCSFSILSQQGISLSEIASSFSGGDNQKSLTSFLEGGHEFSSIIIFIRPSTKTLHILLQKKDFGEPEIPTHLFTQRSAMFTRTVLPFDEKANTETPKDLIFSIVDPWSLDDLGTLFMKGFSHIIKENTASSSIWEFCRGSNREIFEKQLSDFSCSVHETSQGISFSDSLNLVDYDTLNTIFTDHKITVSQDLETHKDQIKYQTQTPKSSKANVQYCSNSTEIIERSPDVLPLFEEMIDGWCGILETQLIKISRGEDENIYGDEPGPNTELHLWRRRFVQLSSLSEPTNSKECCLIFSVMEAASKTSDKDVKFLKSKQAALNVIRRWKQVDLAITEAISEAKDNVKYLITISDFLEPLYTGSPSAIMEVLPSLMGSIKMILSISRYYNTRERLTTIFTKVTNQMIISCRKYISGSAVSIWDEDVNSLIKRFRECITLNEVYQEEYYKQKAELDKDPQGKTFDFSVTQIFGRLDLLTRRLNKLVELFCTIRQFRNLKDNLSDVPGIQKITSSFISMVEDFRRQKHNLLDFHSNKFDREFVDFRVSSGRLETKLHQITNQAFETINSVEDSLELLYRFRRNIETDTLRSELDNKYTSIFNGFGSILSKIQDIYEKTKSTPDIPRNHPPVAGNVAWCRHLLRRIQTPMDIFSSLVDPQAPDKKLITKLSITKEGSNVVRMYNKLAQTLVQFETVWLTAWVEAIDVAKSGLRSPILVRDSVSHTLHVNFDPEIWTLIKESKYLEKMGLGAQAAREVQLQEEKFIGYNRTLQSRINQINKMNDSIRNVFLEALKPPQETLDISVRPGLTTITWSSLRVDDYLTNLESSLSTFTILVEGINDTLRNRIESNFRLIANQILLYSEESESLSSKGKCIEKEKETNTNEYPSISIDDFIEEQNIFIIQKVNFLSSKSREVESAVNSILCSLADYRVDSRVKGITEGMLMKIKLQFNWNFYHSLVSSAKKSINSLRGFVGIKCKSNNNNTNACFALNVGLEGNTVSITPDISVVRSMLQKVAISIIRCSTQLLVWDVNAMPKELQLIMNPNLPPVIPTREDGSSYYDKLSSDKEILKSVILLDGVITELETGAKEYLESFSHFNWLFEGSIDEEYKKFEKTKPSMISFERKLKELSKITDTIGEIPTFHRVGRLLFNTQPLKESLCSLANEWKLAFGKKLHVWTREQLDSLTDEIKEYAKSLGRNFEEGDIDSLASVMKTLNLVRTKKGEIDLYFNPLLTTYRLLDAHLPAGYMGKEERDKRLMLDSSWNNLITISEERQKELSANQNIYREHLVSTITTFKKDEFSFRQLFEEKGPMEKGIGTRQAVEILKRFKEEYDVRSRKMQIYYSGEDIFGLPHQQYPLLDKTGEELGHLTQLYDLYVAVLDTFEDWQNMLWVNVLSHVDSMGSQVENFNLRCKKLPKQVKTWDTYNLLSKEIDAFSISLPILVELAKPSIQQRHWLQVIGITGREELKCLAEEEGSSGDHGMEDTVFSGFKLQGLMDANLNEYSDEILDICDCADKQAVIERKIQEITSQWTEEVFLFGHWKSRDYDCVLQGGRVAEIQEILEEALMQLNTMNSVRHSDPFKEELGVLISNLSESADTIERWIKIQMLWTALESVFTGGDIAKQMPQEAKKFSQIDKDWLKIMSNSSQTRKVIECCQSDLLKQLLPMLGQSLESCQKSLESYLEGKRNKFPRFYFVSDPVLLKILSQGSDPESVQDDFEKIFDAISRVEFDRNDPKKITKIKAIVGQAEELVTLETPVHATGNIEDWLLCLESEMQKSVKRECREAARDTSSVLNGLSIPDFIDRYIGQVALLSIQIIWTVDFQEALYKMSKSKDKNIMGYTNKKFQQMLTDLVQACLTDLGSQMNRTKYETLVTIHVHQRDLFTQIWKKVKEHTVKDENDFEWLKQTRFYWDTDTDNSVVSIADAEFVYSYEYLGVKERLVITPLTDRCYVTLSQALGMFYGGAPAGPAGTGKTETVKDMGRSLGIFVIVTNCSDQHRYKDMAKIFKGLCQSGLWGCFDEFNRIELEVLSVVAMQVESITLAKKQNVKSFNFPGEPSPIRLSPSVGYFITMNPGYAGRQELPENLKVLFRGVSMMVPDREIIMRVKLAAVGYSEMDVLGKKFNVLYRLCEEQLSKQRHYDFGLRNILSVLRTAGGVKRSEPKDADEEMLFMRTVRDMNLSKLVADDVPLFNALLHDLFPRVTSPPKKLHKEIENGISEIVKEKKLIASEVWKLKVIQLYETSMVRHGFMLVGPTLCGKSEIIATLTQCLTKIGQPHRVVTMNPKAITDSQMYGVKDPVSEEWTPGVFATIWAKHNNRALKYTSWLVCDGPVDAIWIENLNTVLDDNKILTLANNDRIPMTDNCRIVFEVENLNNASPATVSRAGIIYVSASDLGYTPLLQSWILHRQLEKEREIMNTIFTDYLIKSDFMDWNRRHLKSMMSVNDSILIVNFLNLLSSLLPGNELLSIQSYRILSTYAITWSFGGLLEAPDRKRFHDKLRQVQGKDHCFPSISNSSTLFEFYPQRDDKAVTWNRWEPEKWTPPKSLNFSTLLIPTLDSCRAEYLLNVISSYIPKNRIVPHFRSVLLVGATGTAKTSTVLMHLSHFSPNATLVKRINFSSATTPQGFQTTIEAEIERKTGKTFCPTGGKPMTVFLDDLSMPLINPWGDQITLELTRQLIEQGGFYFLDKDKRGDFKSIENLQFIGAMGHPGGGRNDIPNRCKSKFFSFNMVAPEVGSVNEIYGNILSTRFSKNCKDVSDDIINVVEKMTAATIRVWDIVKAELLPTPQRFHYIFNMRDLSRVFQGIMSTPLVSVPNGSSMVSLWKHECTRVFTDKLSRVQDKKFVENSLNIVIREIYGDEIADNQQNTDWYTDFLRDGTENDEGEMELAPKVYEAVNFTMEKVREKAYEYLKVFNDTYPAKKMNLVLFTDALCHLMKITRSIQQVRGSAMLVGVGGSGKQSLTRLASFISNQKCFQITLTKHYNDSTFFEDLRKLYDDAGQKNQHVTFLLTDSEIRHEGFLEYMNSILATGEIAGLFQKDERDAMCAEIRGDFVSQNPGVEENMTNLYSFFLNRFRDNLHVVFCFSPVTTKFAIRAQKFPAVFNNVNINWFLPWPEDAMVSVASSFLSDYEIDCTITEKENLYSLLGSFQGPVVDMCNSYYATMRRHVYVTPKSFLCLIDFYKNLYGKKFNEVNSLERSVNIGLKKLNEASEDVEKLKIHLKDEEINLKTAEEETNKLLVEVESETVKAEAKAKEVKAKKDECLRTKAHIEGEQDAANKDLNNALPFLREAETAAKSIKPADITELKTLKTPSDIIRLVFDCVLLLQQKKVVEVKAEEKIVNKQKLEFIHDSYDDYAKSMLVDIRFLPDLLDFSANEKDNINDETCELLAPYLELTNFNPAIAKKASGAAEGLCKWVSAMVMYHEAAKIVKPKMDLLKLQTMKLEVAMNDLKEAEDELDGAISLKAKLDDKFYEAKSNKNSLEKKANSTKKKMELANKLINGLSGEKIRWTDDSNNFALRRKRLVGDVAVASAFISYTGPFNSDFREKLTTKQFLASTMERGVPTTFALSAKEKVDILPFLVDTNSLGEWSLQGLPSDDLSLQNAIMVTTSTRFPLMIDPQGQALRWIRNKENARISKFPDQCQTSLSNPRLKDQLEFTMSEGLCLIIQNVEEDVDPLLDPVLLKAVIKKGTKFVINVSDTQMDYNPSFSLYMTSRLPNPHFSPELSAKCTIIDFTVTIKGLEQQLLGRVLAVEQKSLEASLGLLLEEVTSNTNALQDLDKQLLDRLSNASGNLLDDTELIEVLGNTKTKAKEVETKLSDAAEKKTEINNKREQYRPIATRGSLLYFCLTNMTLISNPVTLQPTGWMYNCSLVQFLQQFDASIRDSERCQPISKRVEKIIDFLTFKIYRYMNRGIFEMDKPIFKLMMALKILTVAGSISENDVSILLKGGYELDIKSEKPNPLKWLPNKVWLNIIQLSRHHFSSSSTPFFSELPDVICKKEYVSQFRQWFDSNAPENTVIPHYEDKISSVVGSAHFLKLVLVRCIREDRCVIAAHDFISKQLDKKYIAPIIDSIESIHQESTNRNPILYLLSTGSDPTSMIDELAKKVKKFPTDKVSMGEGQEVIAWEKMKNAFITGSWLILQNCHLGLVFMGQIEDILSKTTEIDEDFRLWITCEVTNRFPIGLLQISIKVTLEPPMGLKAGLHRTFSTIAGQEMLDKIDSPIWRSLIYTVSFLHSVVQERRKFGPIGWCIPYEFNNSDLEASLSFLEKHLSATVVNGASLSWSTIRYMIADVQYGGRVTDDMDRELFTTYATKWLSDSIFEPEFTFCNQTDFQYKIPDSNNLEIQNIRDYINTIPSVDPPLVFGLHMNADLVYRQIEAVTALTTIQETLPKESSEGTMSRDDQVKEKANEILSKMPIDFIEEEFRLQISKLKGPPGTVDKGLDVPLNIFLFQELQRTQRVISIVRNNLKSLSMAIDGSVVMTPDLLEDVNMIFDGRIPRKWTHDPSGAEISWLVPNLGAWFTGLLDRVNQLNSWLTLGRGGMKSYWLAGFLNPQGFITGMQQEVTRQHKKDHWALDDVLMTTEVLTFDVEKVKDSPDEGQNIHGLFLEGAKWNKQEGRLEESDPKVLFTPMPVVYVTAITSKNAKRSPMDYSCPVYKYPKRNDRYLLFRMNLRSNVDPSHWKLRGVSILCSTE